MCCWDTAALRRSGTLRFLVSAPTQPACLRATIGVNRFRELIAAGAMAGALGLLVSTVIVRVHGVAVFVVTMCVGLLIYEIANRIPWITGGDTGLQGFVMQPLLGRFEFDLFGKTGFWYTYAVSLTMYLSVRRYISSPEGLALEGMRENASRIAAIGISASRRKLMAFTTSAVIAGIAGALLAQITQVVALETLSFDRSLSTLIILIVGGTSGRCSEVLSAPRLSYRRTTYCPRSTQSIGCSGSA